MWHLRREGYPREDGDRGLLGSLTELDYAIASLEGHHYKATGSWVVRVRGDWGWREYHLDDGAVHRYEWSFYQVDHHRCDNCKSPDNQPYMVQNEVWEQSGFGEAAVCFPVS